LGVLAPRIFIRGLRLAQVTQLLGDGGHFEGGCLILTRLSERHFRLDDCRGDNLRLVYIS
jgi:hypothetical protein